MEAGFIALEARMEGDPLSARRFSDWRGTRVRRTETQ
jgi:hypothetical protein